MPHATLVQLMVLKRSKSCHLDDFAAGPRVGEETMSQDRAALKLSLMGLAAASIEWYGDCQKFCALSRFIND